MKKFSITTFGCQMNVHDSEKIAGLLCKQGMSQTEDKKDADLIVFNTCSIRQKAEQKFLSELGKTKSLKRGMPTLKIAVTGCIAQQMGEKLFKKAPYVDYVLGTQNIHLISDLIKGNTCKSALNDNPFISEQKLPTLRKEKFRAWVSIMYGCNNFCSYCVVPYTRGRETCRSTENILKEIKELVGEGVKEVTLLGQNVNSYSSDTDFPGLLEKINAIPGLERLRFVTSHPKDLSDKLITSMESLDKVCEHIHLPLQSGSTRILSLMNRGYSYEEYKIKVDKLRQAIPDIAITSDIIAGFPHETDKDHEDTINALREIEFDGIFAFKFSLRPGTKASLMERHIPEHIKAERLSEILKLQDEITLMKNKELEGRAVDVLIEGISKTNPALQTGRTRGNKIVNFSVIDKERKFLLKEGSLTQVKIIRARRHSLEGDGVLKGST
ncbi:MAG: tRNA (N6-isopentenyl adenosine(37)-C2)-methylthiotransferase MiaB [Nitrospirae bacterium]|nr:tRNA (N6-isopentenyl adenosine(37)-C2)-methylthiotransferase MiaB [Nitrospirota bacterium]